MFWTVEPIYNVMIFPYIISFSYFYYNLQNVKDVVFKNRVGIDHSFQKEKKKVFHKKIIFKNTTP